MALTDLFYVTEIIESTYEIKGNETLERRGNTATIQDRGKLPCMWFAGNRDGIIIGADINNPPLDDCETCPLIGGPIIRSDSIIPSRAFCNYFSDPKNYTLLEGFIEWCWGPNIDENQYGEATWVFKLNEKDKRLLNKGKIHSAKLEIINNTPIGRLHSKFRDKQVNIVIDERQIPPIILDTETHSHEYIFSTKIQPFDEDRGGNMLDLTEYLDPKQDTIKVTIRTDPGIKWDISKFKLHLFTKENKPSSLSYTLLGFALGQLSRIFI